MNPNHPDEPATRDEVVPTAAEMAAAEAELQAIGTAEQLPANTVARLLRAHGEIVGTTRRTRQRILALAATLLLAVSGIAWAGMRVVWPEQNHSKTRLTLADAIAVATEPDRDDHARRGAFGVMVDHAGHAADTVAAVCRDADPALAATAIEVRDDQRRRLPLLLGQPPEPVIGDVVETAQRALDRQADQLTRQQALRELGRIAGACMQAMNSARFTTTEGERLRAAMRDSLGRALR
jgi:hypothetical protein